MIFHRIYLRLFVMKLLFVHFGRYLFIGSMNFQTNYTSRKPFSWILFFDSPAQILTSSFEKMALKDKSNMCHFFGNNMSVFFWLGITVSFYWNNISVFLGFPSSPCVRWDVRGWAPDIFRISLELSFVFFSRGEPFTGIAGKHFQTPGIHVKMLFRQKPNNFRG